MCTCKVALDELPSALVFATAFAMTVESVCEGVYMDMHACMHVKVCIWICLHVKVCIWIRK